MKFLARITVDLHPVHRGIFILGGVEVIHELRRELPVVKEIGNSEDRLNGPEIFPHSGQITIILSGGDVDIGQ